jgi:hypothetical protein
MLTLLKVKKHRFARAKKEPSVGPSATVCETSKTVEIIQKRSGWGIFPKRPLRLFVLK